MLFRRLTRDPETRSLDSDAGSALNEGAIPAEYRERVRGYFDRLE